MTINPYFSDEEREMAKKMFLGLKNQGWKQCTNGYHGECVYEMGDLKCAIGHVLTDAERKLLPNDMLDPIAMGMRGDEVRIPGRFQNIGFWQAAQRRHDDWPNSMHAQFVDLFKHYGLEIPE